MFPSVFPGANGDITALIGSVIVGPPSGGGGPPTSCGGGGGGGGGGGRAFSFRVGGSTPNLPPPITGGACGIVVELVGRPCPWIVCSLSTSSPLDGAGVIVMSGVGTESCVLIAGAPMRGVCGDIVPGFDACDACDACDAPPPPPPPGICACDVPSCICIVAASGFCDVLMCRSNSLSALPK